MRFAYPVYLLLLLIIPWLTWRYISARSNAPIRYSDISRIKKTFGHRKGKTPFTHKARHFLYAIRLIILTLFILAIARPQAEITTSEIYTEGVDIMLVLDVSGSMELIDLDVQNERTRMDVTKQAVNTFIEGRRNDRIGMTIFATDAFLQCPLTVDYSIVKNFLDDIEVGMIPETSTAIGNAIASGLNRLRHTEAKSKVMVLITDGANNAGQIDPFTAAEMAEALDVKIYTIGVGGFDVPYIMADDVFGRRLRPYPEAERIDEESLTQIAQTTGGQYFRAANTSGFIDIFEQIDELEKTKIETQGLRQFEELFGWFLYPALALLFIELILSQTRFRKLP